METVKQGFSDLENCAGACISEDVPSGGARDVLGMLAEVMVEDMIRTERDHGVKPRDLLAHYQARVRQNRLGGRFT